MKKREYAKRKLRHSDRSLMLLSLPTVLWYVCFCYLPLFGIIMAFKKYRLVPGKGFLYSLFAGSRWVGLDNFRYLFMNPQMGTVIRNTVLYNLVFLALDQFNPMMNFVNNGISNWLLAALCLCGIGQSVTGWMGDR